MMTSVQNEEKVNRIFIAKLDRINDLIADQKKIARNPNSVDGRERKRAFELIVELQAERDELLRKFD